MKKERLQKIMARAGLGSRRACEEIIRAGRVTVNGRLADLGDGAYPSRDRILVDGLPLRAPDPLTVVALHKPKQVLSTDRPHKGDKRPTARSLIGLEMRLFAVGRLDAESEGLMLFTNDGELANQLSHPRYGHEKEYRALVVGLPDTATLARWRKGVYLEDGRTAPAKVSVIRGDKRATWLRLTLREGRKRQIRRVAAALGHPVRRLIRVRIGPIRLGNLEVGEWRRLKEGEIRAIKNHKSKIRNESSGKRKFTAERAVTAEKK